MYTGIVFLYLGNIVTQSLTKQSNFIKRKQLIEELYRFGETTTYDEFLLFKGSTACSETDKSYKLCKSNDGNNKLIQGVSHNFDCKLSSQNGLKQTHSVALIMKQEHETVEKPLRLSSSYNEKLKLSYPHFHLDFPIQRYQGPKNH